jgi:hypothetical protein
MDETKSCDGCGHPEHPAHQCPVTRYGERCACDEPVGALSREDTAANDLVQWLRAQLDADEEQARAAAEELGGDWYYDDGFVLARREDDMVATGSQDFLEAERGRFIAAHDPARVLREIDAKRRILDTLHEEGGDRMFADIFRLLALPFADRPGYLEEWRP